MDLADLGDPVHDIGRFFSKERCDFLQIGGCILNDVMQKPCGDADNIHFHFGENISCFQKVGKIGFPGKSDLPLMYLGGIDIGLFNDVYIRLWVVFKYFGGDVS